MIKPAIFLILYALIGVTGWGTYQSINSEKNLEIGLVQLTEKLNELNSGPQEIKNLHRWKDYQGNWNYSDFGLPQTSDNQFDNEIQMLRSLPREALPSDFSITKVNENVLGDIPGLRDIAQLINNAKHLETMLQVRKQNMDTHSEQLKHE